MPGVSSTLPHELSNVTEYEGVFIGPDTTCFLPRAASALCWQTATPPVALPVPSTVRGGEVRSMLVSRSYVCAVFHSAAVECWGPHAPPATLLPSRVHRLWANVEQLFYHSTQDDTIGCIRIDANGVWTAESLPDVSGWPVRTAALSGDYRVVVNLRDNRVWISDPEYEIVQFVDLVLRDVVHMACTGAVCGVLLRSGRLEFFRALELTHVPDVINMRMDGIVHFALTEKLLCIAYTDGAFQCAPFEALPFYSSPFLFPALLLSNTTANVDLATPTFPEGGRLPANFSFVSYVRGGARACAVFNDARSLACNPRPQSGVGASPSALTLSSTAHEHDMRRVWSLSMSSRLVCALWRGVDNDRELDGAPTGQLECWATGASSQVAFSSVTAEARYASVAAGAKTMCAIHINGGASCIGVMSGRVGGHPIMEAIAPAAVGVAMYPTGDVRAAHCLLHANRSLYCLHHYYETAAAAAPGSVHV
ncbi:hypothetical protein EON66_09355, partial [archaeon]